MLTMRARGPSLLPLLRRVPTLAALLLPVPLACTASPQDSNDPFATVTTAPDPTSTASSGTTTGPGTSTSGPVTAESTAVADGSTTDPPKFDVPQPDFQPPKCLQCTLTIASQQSGVFDVFGANVFATAELMRQDVYALGTYGSGRFIATADSSLPFNEVSDCPLVSWLSGGVESPAVMWFGWTPQDGPINWVIPGGVGEGVHLPAQYVGNPALLAADYDIVMYLEASQQFDNDDEPSDQEMQTLLDYVQLHGGGVYVSSEFANPMTNVYLDQDDLDSVNRLLIPLGLESMQVSLNWGNVDGNIDFECFPPPG